MAPTSIRARREATAQTDIRDTLLAAARPLFARGGTRGATARAIAGAAGSPVSAITYHFGSKDALLAACARRAQADAETWLAGETDRLSLVTPSADLLPDWYAALCGHRSIVQRDTTLIAAETFLLSGRSPDFMAVARDWDRMHSAFFQAALPRFGVDAGHAPVFAELFSSLSMLTPSTEDSVFSGAWTGVTARYLAECALGRRNAAPDWRSYMETLAIRRHASRADAFEIPGSPVALRIVESAVRILVRDGTAALTHRAISEESGVALSATTRLFSGRDAILYAAFEHIRMRFEQEIGDKASGIPEHSLGIEDFIASMVRPLSVDDNHIRPELLAMEELFLAARRDPALAPMASQLVASRGQTTMGFLRTLKTQRPAERIDAFIMSLCAFGGLNSLRVAAPQDRAGLAEHRMRCRLGVLFG